jgi:hypothetical protein
MRILGSLGVLSAVVAAGAALSACGTPASTAAKPVAATAQASHREHHAANRARSAHALPAGAAAAASAAPAATPTSSPSPTAASTPQPAAGKLLPAAGNPNGHVPVPVAGRAVNTSHPTRVIGRGTPASCTSAAVVRAVARGGVITFNCGPNPVTINMTATARVHNVSKRVVLDGGGKVVLSGMGQRRILYMNTCDPSLKWTTSHCQAQATPGLIVQNLTFIDGRAPGHDPQNIGTGSGGAIYAQGGEFKVVNSRFLDNSCYAHGPDLGGAAIRAFEEVTPVYIVHSTFTGGHCSNGGALSSIGVSWTVLNSLLARNHAIGFGQNPTQSGTLGGGSGGAIYNDGDMYNLTLNGDLIRFNTAREGGGAVFYVSNNHTGQLYIRNSRLHANPSGQFHNFPGTIFYLGVTQNPVVSHSHLDG